VVIIDYCVLLLKSANYSEVIAEIKKILQEHLSTLVPVENQLEK